MLSLLLLLRFFKKSTTKQKLSHAIGQRSSKAAKLPINFNWSKKLRSCFAQQCESNWNFDENFRKLLWEITLEFFFYSLETFFMLWKLVDFLIKRTTLDSKTSEPKEPTHLFLLAKREIEGAKNFVVMYTVITRPLQTFFLSEVANPIKIFTSKPKMALS